MTDEQAWELRSMLPESQDMTGKKFFGAFARSVLSAAPAQAEPTPPSLKLSAGHLIEASGKASVRAHLYGTSNWAFAMLKELKAAATSMKACTLLPECDTQPAGVMVDAPTYPRPDHWRTETSATGVRACANCHPNVADEYRCKGCPHGVSPSHGEGTSQHTPMNTEGGGQ